MDGFLGLTAESGVWALLAIWAGLSGASGLALMAVGAGREAALLTVTGCSLALLFAL